MSKNKIKQRIQGYRTGNRSGFYLCRFDLLSQAGFLLFMANYGSRKEDDGVDNDVHKQIKDEIIKVLYDNRGNRLLTVSGIRKRITGFDLKSKDLIPYLHELKAEQLICVEKGKAYTLDTIDPLTRELEKEKIQGSDSYFLSPKGIEYYENGCKRKSNENIQLQQIADGINKISDVLSAMLSEYKLSTEEQATRNELLRELREAIEAKDQNTDKNH